MRGQPAHTSGPYHASLCTPMSAGERRLYQRMSSRSIAASVGLQRWLSTPI